MANGTVEISALSLCLFVALFLNDVKRLYKVLKFGFSSLKSYAEVLNSVCFSGNRTHGFHHI